MTTTNDDAPEISAPPIGNGLTSLEKMSEHLRHQLRQAPDLAAALVAAQSEMGAAKKASLNPHFGKKYADLAEVREAILPPLNRHGLALIQVTGRDERDISVSTALVHTSGQSVVGTLSYPAEAAGLQKAGSAISYLRRYGSSAMVFLAQEDDDGNSASEPPPPVDLTNEQKLDAQAGYEEAQELVDLKRIDRMVRGWLADTEKGGAQVYPHTKSWLRETRATAVKRVKESAAEALESTGGQDG